MRGLVATHFCMKADKEKNSLVTYLDGDGIEYWVLATRDEGKQGNEKKIKSGPQVRYSRQSQSKEKIKK